MIRPQSLILVLVLAALGCATQSKGPSEPSLKEIQQQSEFDRGLHALEAQDYAEAAKIFDHLLVQKPASELDLVTLYNSGSAHEGMGECAAAADRFRQVVRSSANKFKRIEAEALYRLSLMYECLGQDTKMISSLLDARRRGKDLAPEVQNAEIPARLAAAYARIGNRQKALEYFTLASRGLKSIVTKDGKRVQVNLIAKTLFLMGQLSPSQRQGTVASDGYFSSVSMQQPYLLQCIELNRPPWSAKAEEDLKTAYQNIWNFKFTDPEVQREFYTRGLQTIQELRKIRMPKPEVSEDAVFALLDQTENRLQKELIQGPESTRLTPDAERREGLHRQGRLVAPDANKKSKSP